MLPWYQNIPFACIFLCMVNGITMPLYRRGRRAFAVTAGVSFAVFALSAVLAVILAAGGERFVYKMGHFPAPWGNEIAADPLTAMLSAMFGLVTGLSLLGGRAAQEADILAPKQPYYFVMVSMLLAALQALAYTNDIFTGYVFIEISTIAACAIVMARDTARTIAATIRYLVISLLGSGLFLIGIVLLYCITGHLLMPQVSEKVMELWNTGRYTEPLTMVVGFITVGLCIKCALFPFHAWLPLAHGGATTSSSAILSGLVLKGYIVLLIKLYYSVFTIEVVRSLKITSVLFVFGIAGMLIGSVQAIREEHIKRMLAYSSIAQIGYVFLGIGLGTEAGMAAAVYQIFVHGVTKPLLFVCAGRLTEVQGHEKSLYRLRGAAVTDPLAGAGFTLGALSMVGLPLLGGFMAKWLLAASSLATLPKLWPALLALAASSVLNALYYVPAVIALWTPSGFMAEKPAKKAPLFLLSALGLAAGVILLGVCCAPLMEAIMAGLRLLEAI
ncbi:MAG TPA: proton-conducting transporter membrane subunit [Clostridia bacterium]|nr:proton-conducting transporter membrane subunit [Clostridia bacterium]